MILALNVVTAVSCITIALLIVRGLLITHQLRRNRLAVATAAIFLTSAAHYLLHGLDLVAGASSGDTPIMRQLMGQPADVVVSGLTAVTGVAYLGLRRSYRMLLSSPAMFDSATQMRYRQLAANLPHTSVFVVDSQLRFLLVAGEDVTRAGFDTKRMEGKLLSDILPATSFDHVAPHYRAALAGSSTDFDSNGQHGEIFSCRARPLRDESGGITGALVLSEDVTAERETQRRLAESQAFNAAVLAASPDVIAVIAMPGGELEWASRSVLETLGIPAEDPIGAEGPRLRELVMEEDRPVIHRAHRMIADLEDGDHLTCRFRAASSDGYRWISRESTPFRRDGDGKVTSYVSIIRDVTDIVEAERRMEHAALHDPLTGLPNRALLLDRMTSALARADRLDSEVAVLFCDLDGFKKVNDTDGHSAGDAVLVEVARRLADMTRRSDSVARVGGDEFVVVLEPERNKSPAADAVVDGLEQDAREDNPALRTVATLVADRIRAELSRPIQHLGRTYQISVSIGMTFAPRRSLAIDVLRDADLALYRAKQRGRNRVEVFDEALGADVVERSRVERTLREALEPQMEPPTTVPVSSVLPVLSVLSVAYQPVYNLADDSLVGFEALARLTDALGHPVAPDVFIPIAEETGLITRLGERVLDDALACLVQWKADHPPDQAVTMAVNLSARQAQHADMPSVVRAALTRHHLSGGDLILELTESVLLESGTSTLRQLTELRDIGVGIAIDDFGTGYASLRYLANLPVSSVKVDRSFTATMMESTTSTTIVRAIATLAKDLGLHCVVEGVESHEQLDALPFGVQGQGYLMGRPTAVPQNNWLAAAR